MFVWHTLARPSTAHQLNPESVELMGGDLGGLGGRSPKFKVEGTVHAPVPPISLRSSAIGIMAKYELTEKGFMADFFWIEGSYSQVKVKNILFQQNHNIVCIIQKHQNSLVEKRLHKRENPAKNGQA